MEKERDIYIKDMLFYVFRKWKMILLWMAVFAVAADGVAALKSYKNVIELQSKDNSAENSLAAAKVNLSKEEVKRVEDTYKLYLTYKKSLDKSMDYYSNSLKMQIDPNRVATINIQYSVNSKKSLKDIVEAFSNIVLSEESCEVINKKLGLDSKTSYISELIKFGVSDSVLESNKNNEKIDIIESNDSSMIISIIAAEKDSCEIMADIVEEKILEAMPKIEETMGAISIKKIDRNFSNRADSNLLNEQQNYMTNLNAIKTSMTNLNAALSDNQKGYYTALINENEENYQNQDVENSASFQLINIKYIILGLIAGIFMSILWYVVSYVLNNSLKSVRELEEKFDVSVLGEIETDTMNKNIIDRLIYSIFVKNGNESEDNVIDFITTNILISIEKKDIKAVHITGVSNSENVERVKEELVGKVQKLGIDLKCTSGKSVVKDVESLKNLSDSESVILIEEVWKSDFFEINKEVQVCQNNNVDIIGAVILK